MVQIKIKGMNDTYHVIADYDDPNEFFNVLKERLIRCLVSEDSYFEAFFHIPLKKAEDVQRLFMVCKECHTRILGINEIVQEKVTRVVENDLRGGETYRFYEPVIILGNIHTSAYVVSSESIYVVGKVSGNIDLLHDDCTLCAATINANIRICDSNFQNMTSFSSCKVYYDTRTLKIMKYKEEMQWERL